MSKIPAYHDQVEVKIGRRWVLAVCYGGTTTNGKTINSFVAYALRDDGTANPREYAYPRLNAEGKEWRWPTEQKAHNTQATRYQDSENV